LYHQEALMRVGIAVSALLLFCLLGASAVGQQAPQDQAAPKKAFKFENTQVQDALNQLAKQFSVQIVQGPGLTGTVTATLQAADVEEALTAICVPSKLSWRKFTFFGEEPAIDAETLGRLVEGAEKLEPQAFAIEGYSDKAAIGFYRMPVADLPKPLVAQEPKIVYYVFAKKAKAPSPPTQGYSQRQTTAPTQPGRSGQQLYSDFANQFKKMSLQDRVNLYNQLSRLIESDRELMEALHGPVDDIEFPEPPPPPEDMNGGGD
jgi:hypothetical protein